MHFVIPGLTKPAPYLIRGNPVLFWIPAFAGMTQSFVINDAVYNSSHFRLCIFRLSRLGFSWQRSLER